MTSAPTDDRVTDRLEASGFYKLLLSARKLEWRPPPSSNEIAVYDREHHVTIVTDRRAFERFSHSRAATKTARHSG